MIFDFRTTMQSTLGLIVFYFFQMMLFLTIVLGIFHCISEAVRKPPIRNTTEISATIESTAISETEV